MNIVSEEKKKRSPGRASFMIDDVFEYFMTQRGDQCVVFTETYFTSITPKLFATYRVKMRGRKKQGKDEKYFVGSR